MKPWPMIASVLLATTLCSCVVVPVPHSSTDVSQFSGRVRDHRTGRPVPGASIVLTGLPATTTQSDAAGYFLTHPSRTLHLLGVYTYDGGVDMQFPPPRYATGPLRISHPNYQTREIRVDSNRRDEPFGPKRAPVDLKDVYLDKRSP